jgi:hypothetical protein
MIPPPLKPSPLAIDTVALQPPFQLFGLSIATNHSFENRFPPAGPPSNLLFIRLAQAPVPVDWANEEPLYTSRGETKDGESLFTFYATGNCVLLRFAAFADFYLWSDMIVCHVLHPEYEFMVEISFLGTVLACWFELQGILALHAAASVINGQAVAFLSSNKGGKSSLAATLMQQGYPLLTDDILLIEQQNGRILGRSSYPQMRLWPEQAAQLFGRSQEFPKVQPYLDKRRIPIDFEKPGNFETGRFPLTHCYIPERYTPEKDKADITITPVPPIQSVLTLAGYSFLYWLVETIGLQPGRLKTLAQVAQTVTVSRLEYPESVEHLSAVCQAILSDL